MDRERLRRYIERGLSLIQIGALENRDPSTVGHWVNKHGLEANGKAKYAPRGGITREQREPLVEAGSTLEELAGRKRRGASFSVPTATPRWRSDSGRSTELPHLDSNQDGFINSEECCHYIMGDLGIPADAAHSLGTAFGERFDEFCAGDRAIVCSSPIRDRPRPLPERRVAQHPPHRHA